MVKISKVQLNPNAKMLKNNSAKPTLLNVIALARFSGAEFAEKFPAKAKASNEQSLFHLQQKLESSKNEFLEIAKKSLSNVIESGNSLLFDLRDKKLTKNLLNKIKEKRLQHKNYFSDIESTFLDTIRIPYLNKLCTDCPVKQIFTLARDSMITSPRLLIYYINGINTASHNNSVKNLKKIYSSCTIEELLNVKNNILNEFSKYTNTNTLIPDYKLSKSEIKRLNQLTEKYDASDELLKSHNIRTYAIEALFYSGIEKCSKPGDILPNKDIILSFSNVYDRSLKKNIPTILSFANTDVGYRFKSYRYDEDLILNIEKYKKQFSYYIKTKNYKSINNMNNKIFEYLKNMEVSEVFVEPKDIAGVKREMSRCPDMTEEKMQLLKISQNNILYYIKDLKNYNIKRYYNASTSLIKCLKEFGKINDIKEAYTEALAFNNVQHSPVGMYIRNGFKPISITTEELEKDLYSKTGFDYKKSVWMVYKL